MGLFGRGKQHAEDEHEQENYRPQPASVSPESVAFETVIGPGASFRGNLSSPGSVRIEGTFVGDLELDGNILIGEHARVTADINAANVTIAGAVRGNISGERVQLLRTGRVWGDIQSSSISTEDGAFIRGTITMRGGDIPPIFAEMAAETGSLPPPTEPLEVTEGFDIEPEDDEPVYEPEPTPEEEGVGAVDEETAEAFDLEAPPAEPETADEDAEAGSPEPDEEEADVWEPDALDDDPFASLDESVPPDPPE